MIHSAAVLGAGTMGAQIAAHLANAGLPVLLLDVTADAAKAGLERARKTRPDPFFLPDTAAAIRTGSFDDYLAEAGTADWIIEAIVEKLDAKHALLGRLAPHLTPRSIVSTNTSGIPIHRVAQAFTSASQRARFLGTHFFNPPRYLPLVEMIRTADTDPQLLRSCAPFSITGWARAWSSRTTGPDSSPTASGFTAWRARWNSSRTAATRSTK